MADTAPGTYAADSLPAISFAEAVLHRPLMYTLRGTLDESLCFIDGYYHGVADHNPAGYAMLAKPEWFEFLRFLANRLSGENRIELRELVALLRETYPDDKAASAFLIRTLEEYRASMTRQEGGTHA